MSVSVTAHSVKKTELEIHEQEWSATAAVEYVDKPADIFVHDEGCSILYTSEKSCIRVSVSVERCEKRELQKNINDFPYYDYVCAEAWALLWGKLYAPL